MSDLERFLELETDVWHALVNGDGAADAALLSNDFVGVYPTGFATRAEHVAQLADGPTIASFELTDARLMTLSSTAVLLSYKADYRRPATPMGDAAETMYISSLWCERDGRWINVFSQDTPAS